MKRYESDVLIIGGGACGCYAAIKLGLDARYTGIVVDKAGLKRSGCLAAGINAINAYLDDEESPEEYVNYVKSEFQNIVREDLIFTIGERLNEVTKDLEKIGVPFLKTDDGKYIRRGRRSVKINGENIKPLVSSKLKEYKNIKVIEKVTIVDLIVKNKRVIGAVGIDFVNKEMVIIYAKAVLCATGGASGMYKPNNSGYSKHKMWYSPFNTGAGYAMGIRAGAEMTSFECRFIALRLKDTIAPTGTIAQGIGATQINSLGEEYLKRYTEKTTQVRLLATITENIEGRGPCYLRTKGISNEEEEQLKLAYLNMAPSQVLRWFENEIDIKNQNVEIEGTEPYIVGGHSSCGYWIDKERRTTIKGLYAGGDVAGGSPKKYVTGAMSEGSIAIESILKDIKSIEVERLIDKEEEELRLFILKPLIRVNLYEFVSKDIEDAMQKIMDEYAGGISTNYQYSEERLKIGEKEIISLLKMTDKINVSDYKELINLYELKDRLLICRVIIAHMLARKETRFRAYGENLTYREKKSEYELFINSVLKDGGVKIIKRNLSEGEDYFEH